MGRTSGGSFFVDDPAIEAGKIVFNRNIGSAGNAELCKMDPDGTNIVALTNDPAYHSWFAQVTGDRRWIVFCRTLVADVVGPNWQNYAFVSIWKCRGDGSDLAMLSDKPSTHTTPVAWTDQGTPHWSPDGTEITFFGGPVRAGGAKAGLIMDPEGNLAARIYDDGTALTDPAYSHPAHHINASVVTAAAALRVSPAMFACLAGTVWRLPRLQILPTATPEGLTLITNPAAAGFVADFDPCVHPSGRWLAFLTKYDALGDAGTYGIRSLRIDQTTTTVPRILWGPTGDVGDVSGNITSKPEFTPDGTEIWTHRRVDTGLAQGYDGDDVDGWRIVKCAFDELTGIASAPVTILNDAHINEFPFPT